MKWNDLEEQPCSIARAISVVGDRWSLMILRDCFLRVRRFDDFQARLGITRHLLSGRLKKFVASGVLRRVPYQDRPRRYEYVLTQKGLDLYPVLMALVHWGDVHMADANGRPVIHHHKDCGHAFDPMLVCSECHEPLDPRAVHVHSGPGARDSMMPAPVRKAE